MLGAKNPESIASAKHRAWSMSFDFGNIVAGGTQTVIVRNDQARLFVVDYIVGCSYLTAAASPSIAGTLLADYGDPSPPASVGNTLSSTALIDVEFSTDNGPWMSGPIAWPNLIGTARQPFAPRFNWAASPGVQVRCVLTNGTAAGISGQIVLHGRQLDASR